MLVANNICLVNVSNHQIRNHQQTIKLITRWWLHSPEWLGRLTRRFHLRENCNTTWLLLGMIARFGIALRIRRKDKWPNPSSCEPNISQHQWSNMSCSSGVPGGASQLPLSYHWQSTLWPLGSKVNRHHGWMSPWQPSTSLAIMVNHG